jgi:glutathione S-transferase
MGTRVMLEEIGAPYELIQSTIAMDEPRPPEQLAINPNGWVPVLVWDEGAMYECAAITVFLCDRHPEANLAPAVDDPERGLYLQTLVYFSNSVQNAFQLNYYPSRFADTPADEPSAQRRGNRRLRETWKVIDDQIGDDEWVLGERFSAVDIYLFMLTTWLKPSRGQPSVDEFPNCLGAKKHPARLRPVDRRAYMERVMIAWGRYRSLSRDVGAFPKDRRWLVCAV